MPIPGLIDTYAFADWMKVNYAKAGRPLLFIKPENGGLLTVAFHLPLGKEHCATSQIQEQSRRLTEYQDGDQSRSPAEAGSGDCAVGGVSQSEAQTRDGEIICSHSLREQAEAFPAIPAPAPRGVINPNGLRLAYAQFGGY